MVQAHTMIAFYAALAAAAATLGAALDPVQALTCGGITGVTGGGLDWNPAVIMNDGVEVNKDQRDYQFAGTPSYMAGGTYVGSRCWPQGTDWAIDIQYTAPTTLYVFASHTQDYNAGIDAALQADGGWTNEGPALNRTDAGSNQEKQKLLTVWSKHFTSGSTYSITSLNGIAVVGVVSNCVEYTTTATTTETTTATTTTATTTTTTTETTTSTLTSTTTTTTTTATTTTTTTTTETTTSTATTTTITATETTTSTVTTTTMTATSTTTTYTGTTTTVTTTTVTGTTTTGTSTTTTTTTGTSTTTATETTTTVTVTTTTETATTTTTTTATVTTTTRTTTTTTTTTGVVLVVGDILLTVADPDAFKEKIDNDPAVQQAIAVGLAGGIPGLEPEGVTILGTQVEEAGGRRLRSEGGRRLTGAVKVTFQLALPHGSQLNAAHLAGLLDGIVASLVPELEAAAGVTVEVAVDWNLPGPPGSMSEATQAGAKASGSLFIVGLLGCCLVCGTGGCIRHCIHNGCHGKHHKEGEDEEACGEDGSCEMREVKEKSEKGKDLAAVRLDDCPSDEATATPFSTLPSVDAEHPPLPADALPTLHLGGRHPSGDGWKAPEKQADRQASCDSLPPVAEEFERQARTPPSGWVALGESPPPVPRDAEHHVPRMSEWQAVSEDGSEREAAKARVVSLGEASPAFSADAAADEELQRSLEEARRQASEARREALEATSPRSERGIALDDVRFDEDEQGSEFSAESIKPLPGLGFDWSQLPVVESDAPAACRPTSPMPLNVQVTPAPPAWGHCGPTCLGSGGMAVATLHETEEEGPSI